LESQKQTLEDEQREKEKAFEKERIAVEAHYDALLKPFDKFVNDVEGRSETLKQLQILKDSEKNTEVLKNLDKFISDYQSKMKLIANYSLTQEQSDLNEYNSNKDAYDAAKKRGDLAEMQRLKKRNDEIRSMYGINSDTGKLQQFSEGGTVKGPAGQPVNVIAHAGEMILNGDQQLKLFDMIRFYMPRVEYSTPKTVQNFYYSFDNSIGSVAVQGTNGVSGLYDQRGGIISRQQALGEKVR
jgi:hypothetical protein